MSNRTLANQIKDSIIEDYDHQCLWHYSFENYEWMMYDMVREELEKREIGDLSKSDIEHILVEVFSHSVAEWVKEAQKFNMYSLSEYVTLLYNKLLEKWKQKNQ